MAKYVFKDGEILTIKAASKADPDKIGLELETIATKAGGHLTPSAIVAAARDRKNILHPHFEWDDKVAAEAFRLDQARSLVRAIYCENAESESGVARAFLSVKEKDGVSYRSISDVLGSQDLQQRILAQAEKDLIAWEGRYRELEDVCALVKEARARLSQRRIKNESRVSA